MIADLVTKGKIATTISQTTSKSNILSARRAIKTSIKEEVTYTWNNKVRHLTIQGEFVQLLVEEEQSVTWQSIIRKMPRNVMSFAARLCTNSLNSPDNLVRWGKRNMGSCPLCKAKYGPLAHIVNFCPVSLKHYQNKQTKHRRSFQKTHNKDQKSNIQKPLSDIACFVQ